MRSSSFAGSLFAALFALGTFACSAGDVSEPSSAPVATPTAAPGAAPGGGTSTSENPVKEAPAGGPTTFAAQATAGSQLFAANCARCHGDAGEGRSAPALVGLQDGALGSFATAEDMATFIIANMPPGGAGRLSESEYYSIVAFDLQANGIVKEQPIDKTAAATIQLH